jgi:hypothetical protein
MDTVLDGRKFLGGLEGPETKTVESFVKQQQHQQQQLEHQRPTTITTAAMNLALPGMYIRCTVLCTQCVSTGKWEEICGLSCRMISSVEFRFVGSSFVSS